MIAQIHTGAQMEDRRKSVRKTREAVFIRTGDTRAGFQLDCDRVRNRRGDQEDDRHARPDPSESRAVTSAPLIAAVAFA